MHGQQGDKTMRVTNSMLSNNLMRNLHTNYRRTNDLHNMMSTGRRFAHISDNPTALIYSQAARNKIARLSHFQRTTETAQSWLTQAENSMRELQDVIVNAYESLVDATTDGKTANDRNNIAQVIGQYRNHFVDTLNSTFGNNFVFGGFNTPGDSAANLTDNSIRPFVIEDGRLMFNGFDISQFDGMPAILLESRFTGTPAQQLTQLQALIASEGIDLTALNDGAGVTEADILMLHRLRTDVLTFDVGPGIEMPVTMNGLDIIFFTTRDENNNPITRNMFGVLSEIYEATTNDAPAIELTRLIRPLQDGQNHMLARVAEMGGRSRRIELLQARYEQDRVNNRQMQSDAEDADLAEVIMDLRMAEAVMQASMAAGARVIQPSLMDFLR
jgi:flagellar hook-associated protein 3 FlgL